MIPWLDPESRLLIGMAEDEFTSKLGAVGNESYLGNSSSFQLFHIFAFQGSWLSLLTLLDKGVDIFSTTDFGINVLHLAAAGGHEGLVNILLNKGFKVDLKVEKGRGLTPLMFASCMGHANIVALLLENGADLKLTDNDDNSALCHAAARGHDSVAGILLDNGADPKFKNPENGWSPLHHASHNGHAKVVKKLLKHGSDVNSLSLDGLSSLFRAAAGGYPEVVRLLLQNGADPNVKVEDGWTPLGAAAWKDRVEVVQVLMESDELDMEARMGSTGRTALKIAVDLKLERITQLLLTKGADIWATDNCGESPLSSTRKNRYSSHSIRRLLADAENQGGGQTQQVFSPPTTTCCLRRIWRWLVKR